MSSLRVTQSIGDLANDLATIPVKMAPRLAGAVRRNIEQGNARAQRLARAKSGPHGKNYYKRLTAESTGPLQGEYGPEGDVVGNAVGAGWRNNPPNTDLPKSADVQGPKFARDVGKIVDRAFW